MSLAKMNKYKSRSERYKNSVRKIKIIALFAAIAGVVLLYKNRVYIWDWLRWQFS